MIMILLFDLRNDVFVLFGFTRFHFHPYFSNYVQTLSQTVQTLPLSFNFYTLVQFYSLSNSDFLLFFCNPDWMSSLQRGKEQVTNSFCRKSAVLI